MPQKTLINCKVVTLEVPLKQHPDLRTGVARAELGNDSFSFPVHISKLYLRPITRFCCNQMHFECKHTLNWKFTSVDLCGGLRALSLASARAQSHLHSVRKRLVANKCVPTSLQGCSPVN